MAVETNLAAARAKFAYERVVKSDWNTRTTTEVKGLPVLIRTVGLLQAVAMLAEGKEGSATAPLAAAIASWLLSDHPERYLVSRGTTPKDLLASLAQQSDPVRLRYADREAIELAVTLKLISGALHG